MQVERINNLVNAYSTNNFAEIKVYIQSLPVTESTSTAIGLLESNDSYYVISAMDSMAASYYFSRNFDIASTFSFATYYCVQLYLKADFTFRKAEMLYYAGSSSYYILKCFLDTADYTSGIWYYKSLKDYFGEAVNKPEFLSAHLTAVDLYLSNNDVENARKLFAQIQQPEIQYYNKPYYDRLAEKLRRLFSRVSVLPSEAALKNAEKLKENLQAIINSFESSMNQKNGNPSENELASLKEIQLLIKELQECRDEDKLIDLCSMVGIKIANYYPGIKNNEEADITAKRNQVQQLALIVLEENDKDLVQQILKQLLELLSFFEHKFPADENHILWLMATYYSWFFENEMAITTLERLHSNLDLLHAGIKNKMERGGVYNQFPLLFNLLIRNYYIAKQPKGVLKGIEASKGRILADNGLETERNEKVNYQNLTGKLEELLARENAHYLSFFVDEDYTISVLVTSNGKYYAKGIEINRKTIDDWTNKNYQNPANWSNAAIGLFGAKKKIDLSKELEKFLFVITLAMDEGNLKEGDHIVYSQDENFILFPLHYALFKERYLIESFSLSRIHNAFQLIGLMEQNNANYNKVVCFNAPSKQDEAFADKINAFREVEKWLGENVELSVVAGEAEIMRFKDSISENAIIHFATHGVFPNINFTDFEKNNPYYNSGLLLNVKDQPPELEINFDYYKTGHLLSPEILLQLDGIFNHTHVSFQACVSGRAKEGIAGDAIGMEWAAFYCGANSLLSAAWDIDIFWVNKFFILFYDNWINNKMSRAVAYATTMRSLLQNKFPSEKPKVYFWGGMILSGNWKT